MYARQRSVISARGGQTGPKDVKTREREEVKGESDGGQERAEARRAGARGSMMRRRHQVAYSPSLFSRAVESVIKLLRLAEFEILFVLFFVITFLLFKDLTARPAFNQLLYQKRFEEQDRLY